MFMSANVKKHGASVLQHRTFEPDHVPSVLSRMNLKCLRRFALEKAAGEAGRPVHSDRCAVPCGERGWWTGAKQSSEGSVSLQPLVFQAAQPERR